MNKNMESKLQIFGSLPIFVLPLILVTGTLVSSFSFSLALIIVTLFTSLLVHMIKNIVQARFLYVFALLISAFFSTLIAIILYFNIPKLFDYFGLSLCFLSVSQIHFFNPKTIFNENTSLMSSIRYQFKLVGGFFVVAVLLSLVREVLGHGTITYAFDLTSLGQIRIPGLIDYPIRIIDSPVFVFIVTAILIVMHKRKKVA